MKKNIISFISGLIFSIGLVISGMINPHKVIGFLNIFGEWNFSLLFVMVGAIGLHFFLFKFIIKRKPILCENHSIPKNNIIDKKLIIGASLFGVGWGLLGICPGPGIVNLATLEKNALLFIISMTLGMILFHILKKFKVL